MKKLIILYIDALKEDYLQFMPFLSNFAKKNSMCRTKTVLGYSVAAHGAIVTGCYPEKNNIFLSFYHKRYMTKAAVSLEKLSYFKIIPGYYPRLVAKYAASKILQRIGFARGFDPGMHESAYENLCFEEVIDDKTLIMISGKPTLFTMIGKKTPYTFDDIMLSNIDTQDTLQYEKMKDNLLIYYTAIIDNYSQYYGIHDPKFKKILKKFDALLERFLKEALAKDADILIFSDHGMVNTKKVIDIEKELSLNNIRNGRDYFAMFDLTFARFWIKDKKIKKKIKDFFHDRAEFELLDDENKRRYHIDFKNNKYGDLMYLCRPGMIIANPIRKKAFRNIKSMHAFSPEYEEMDAVLITNFFKVKEKREIVDICPTLLRYYGLDIPPHIDGRSMI